MKLARFAVNRPVSLGMLTLSVIVLGVISVGRIPLESYPSISSSSVSVSVNYPSASPEEIERKITIPLEQSLALLGNLEEISSSSGGNSASVRLSVMKSSLRRLMICESNSSFLFLGFGCPS